MGADEFGEADPFGVKKISPLVSELVELFGRRLRPLKPRRRRMGITPPSRKVSEGEVEPHFCLDPNGTRNCVCEFKKAVRRRLT